MSKRLPLILAALFTTASCVSAEGLYFTEESIGNGNSDKTSEEYASGKSDSVKNSNQNLRKNRQNGKWGFIDEDGNLVIPYEFDFILNFSENLAVVRQGDRWGFIDKVGNFAVPLNFECALSFSEGLAAVEQNGKWGFIDKTGHFVIPCTYEDASSFENGLAFVRQNDERFFVDKYGNHYENKSQALAAFHDKFDMPFSLFVESQLGTLETFLAARSMTLLTPEALQSQVEKEVAQWQQKGEFETTAMWQQRVNEKTRTDKAHEIATRIIDAQNASSKEAREAYRLKYDELAREYCDHYSQKFNFQELRLHPYDADNQTFLIDAGKYGNILLPVPIDEAPAFKKNWESVKKSVDVEFIPFGANVAISSAHFGKYVYDSDTQSSYASVDVDYNFKPIDLSTLNYNFGDLASAETDASVTSPGSKTVTPRTIAPEQRKVSAGSASDIDTNIPDGVGKSPATFAVIIANGEYAHASSVANAANDGRVMEQYLTRTLGIPEKNVTTYINATYGQMASAVSHLEDIASAYGQDKFSVIFFYVGHGLPDDANRESFILPVDVDPRNTDICYPLKKLYSQLGNLGASRVTVMVDACFSGANHGDGMLVPQSMGVKIKPEPAVPSGNMVVLSAAEGDQTAYPYEEKGHGLFTYWLLKKIRDTKGKVTLGELSDYVLDNVRKTSVVENSKLQTPSVAISSSLSNSWRSLPLTK